MILLCSGEDSVYSSSSSESDVIMISNCINDVIIFSYALLKTQLAFNIKMISLQTFSDLHFAF